MWGAECSSNDESSEVSNTHDEPVTAQHPYV